MVANLATTTVASIQNSSEWEKERRGGGWGVGGRQYIGMVSLG